MDIPIIVLGAGQSTRMGGTDKLLQHVDGQPLIRRQADMARRATTGAVIVALPPAPHPRYAALQGLDVQTLGVEDAAEGMNASLRAAFAALPEDSRAAMLVLADLPDLTMDDLKSVGQAVDKKPEMLVWRGATETGKPGHPVVFAASLFPAFAALSGDSGGQDVVRQAQGRVALVPLQGTRARLDLDTPEAWAAWRAVNPDR